MSEINTVVSHQWATRPADQRFESLTALAAYKRWQKQNSRAATIVNRNVTILPEANDPFGIGVNVRGPRAEYVTEPTHWAFGQLCARAKTPAGYMRSGLPGALIADCLNWSLQHHRAVEDMGILFHRRENGSMELQAVTGAETYGRVWDCDIADVLVDYYGDGRTGQWRAPGEFGKAVEITKENTTFYASDSDMFVFLCDEERRVTIENRRDGAAGTLARGFYISNSQVGKSPLRFGMFLFDYACCNRILWGVGEQREISIIHRSSAPNHWVEEIRPILQTYAEASPMPVEATLRAAQQRKIDSDVNEWLTSRFGKGPAGLIQATHMAEEQRPIESVWDAVTGATAYARSLTHQDERVLVERTAGALLSKIAVAA